MLKSSLFLLIFLCFIQLHSYAFPKNINEKESVANNNCIVEIYYELTLEKIFPIEDKQKFEASFSSMDAPFIIDQIDYESKSFVLKLIKKVPFDEIKKCLDKVGLRVTKYKEFRK